MTDAKETVAAVLHADRQYIQAAQDRIAELELENSKLRACNSYHLKNYRELVPDVCWAHVDGDDVRTEDFVYHSALVKFLEKNDTIEAFEKVLAAAHKAWTDCENAAAQLAARDHD